MKKNQNENLIDVVLVAAAAGAAAAAAILAADKALKSEKGQAAVATVKPRQLPRRRPSRSRQRRSRPMCRLRLPR